jgi:hypothetical protein
MSGSGANCSNLATASEPRIRRVLKRRQAGEPGIGNWLVTVTPTGQTITLEPGS